jgi:hypothetical protein
MDAEKREAFRITEEALLAVVGVTPDARARVPVETHFQSAANVDAIARFADLDQGFRECQARLARIDAVAAEACDWLAAQIDLLRDAMFSATGGDRGLRRGLVSISATGLGFEHPEKFGAGAAVAVRLVLLPQHEPIVSYARVRQSRERGDAHFVGIEFVDLAAEYQRRLNRHMLKAQINTKARAPRRLDASD